MRKDTPLLAEGRFTKKEGDTTSRTWEMAISNRVDNKPFKEGVSPVITRHQERKRTI